jgi:hypothetical protein
MFRNRWLMLTGVIVVLGLLAWGWSRSGSPAAAVDLVPLLEKAEKKSGPLPVAEAIKLVTVAIGGESKPCILEQSVGRIKFAVKVPADAWFSASLAVDPTVWEKPGDGVLFRMGVVAGPKYDELLNQYVNPVANASDRRWIPVAVDLSAYAGQDVFIQLSTNPGPPGKPTDMNNDLGLWGSPAITTGK